MTKVSDDALDRAVRRLPSRVGVDGWVDKAVLERFRGVEGQKGT